MKNRFIIFSKSNSRPKFSFENFIIDSRCIKGQFFAIVITTSRSDYYFAKNLPRLRTTKFPINLSSAPNFYYLQTTQKIYFPQKCRQSLQSIDTGGGSSAPEPQALMQLPRTPA